MIPLSERLLADAGGWQALKQARTLYEAGRVIAAGYQPPLLEGRVRGVQGEFRAGLRILSKSNVENLCTCRQSKQYGTICEHSLAVGLAVLNPRPVEQPKPAAVVAPPQAVSPSIFGPEGTGAVVELFIVLAPNLGGVWERNSLTVGAEAAIVGGKRVLLGALDQSRSYRATPADIRVIDQLREFAGGQLPGMLSLNRGQFLELLATLKGHPRVTLGKATTLTIAGEPVKLGLSVERTSSGAARLKVGWPEATTPLVGDSAAWLLSGTCLRETAAGLPMAYRDVLKREITIPAESADQFLARELPALMAWFEIDPVMLAPVTGLSPARMMVAPAARERPEFVLKLEGSLNYLAAELESVQGDKRVSLGGTGYRAGHPGEAIAMERLRQSGFAGPDGKGQWTLKGEPSILAFFAGDLPRLERDWTVTIGARFEHVTRDVERIQPRLEVRSSGENWFELNVEMGTASGERFSGAEIQRLLQSGRGSVRLKSGKTAVFNSDLIDEFQQVLQDCNPQQRQPGQYRIDSQHAAYLGGMAAENHLTIEGPQQWQARANAPRQMERLTPVGLGDLDGVLRPYQKQGVYWLNFLAQNGWGGILADEMGLGKTVQMLAFLRLLGGRALVVCPSSLVYNWRREAARFAPELKVLEIQGPKRQELFASIETANLVITSYPLLRRDADRYRGIQFRAMVLDEAQHIKNPESQNAQAAQGVHAQHRFVLTGTPVENSVRDIWSIMNFVMPGYLGNRADFKERFEGPIQNEPGGPEQRRLGQRLKPFILRRLKRTVAPELPDKIEQVAYCELSGAQRETYSKLLEATRRQVSELASSKDQGKARILMLTALLRLRQACCDLRLLGMEEAEIPEPSAKLELLEELLLEALDGGHRVLVFSQFVSMLKLIRTQLEAAGTAYCYLDGSTKDRQAVVDRFQTGEVPVFLMSLKAGGVGLNLTAADTVIHFDPWWNPAVEAQATDRAHRIGQKSVVTAYKLIARGTLEEKILALQVRKQGLVDATIESDQPLMEALSVADIESLLE